MSERSSTVHRLKITLRDVRPPIWRRLLLPSDTSLGGLHEHIQTAMGWWDTHLHEFRIGSTAYGLDDGEGWGEPPRDEATVTLADIAPVNTSFTYVYDFGDNWQHHITVEAVDPLDPGLDYPLCLAGRRASPPEDCGGVPGYLELIEALADPKNPRRDELRDWVGGEFDPEQFETDQINAAFAIGRAAQRS